MSDAPELHASEPTPAHRAPAPSKNMIRTAAIGAGIAILVGIVAFLAVTLFGVYRLGWENGAARFAANTLPLTAASVNGRGIPLSTYLDDVGTVRHFFAKQTERAVADGTAAPEAPEDDVLRGGVLDRLIATEILKEEAEKRNLTLSQEAIDQEYQNFVAAEQTTDAAKEILDLYGWSVEEFKQKVMVPYLLQQELANALAEDPALAEEVKAKADEVLAMVKDGGNFEELARQYSTDVVSGQNGGDLGEFGKGIMVPEFEQAAFALEKDQVTQELVKTQFGWHIIQVYEVNKDASGEVTTVKARHILIGNPSVEEYLDKKLSEARVEKHVHLEE